MPDGKAAVCKTVLSRFNSYQLDKVAVCNPAAAGQLLPTGQIRNKYDQTKKGSSGDEKSGQEGKVSKIFQ